jgi:hypothetical protein
VVSSRSEIPNPILSLDLWEFGLYLLRSNGEVIISSVFRTTSRFFLNLVFSVCISGTFGQAKANETAVSDFWVGTKFDGGLRKNRIDVAKEMLKDLRQFRNYLPVQKPAELERN